MQGLVLSSPGHTTATRGTDVKPNVHADMCLVHLAHLCASANGWQAQLQSLLLL